ncbi:PASTA domain-containing protein [Mycolicibacterium gilvum]|nr:PASTA domain-containing protein [Mycolicibacterium gilvum]
MVVKYRKVLGERKPLLGLAFAIMCVNAVACSSSEPPAEEPGFVMPSLVGQYWTDAYPELVNEGWSGTLEKLPSSAAGPENSNRIIMQDPPAGTRIDSETVITLRFGA